MAKEKLTGLSTILSEKSVDKIIAAIEKMVDKGIEMKEEENIMKAENMKEEKERVRKEFNRIADLMEKEDPTTERYKELADALYKIKSILSYWT